MTAVSAPIGDWPFAANLASGHKWLLLGIDFTLRLSLVSPARTCVHKEGNKHGKYSWHDDGLQAATSVKAENGMLPL